MSLTNYSIKQLDGVFKFLGDDNPLRSQVASHIEHIVDSKTNPDGSLMDHQAFNDPQPNNIEKGRKGGGAPIGSFRVFGGRKYIKTGDGWKYYGKGTGTKGTSAKVDTSLPQHIQDEIAELTSTRETLSERLLFTSNPSVRKQIKVSLDKVISKLQSLIEVDRISDIHSTSPAEYQRQADRTTNSPKLRDLYRNAAALARQINSLKSSGNVVRGASRLNATNYRNVANDDRSDLERRLNETIKQIHKYTSQQLSVDDQYADVAKQFSTRTHPTSEGSQPVARPRHINHLNHLPVGAVINATTLNGTAQLYKKVKVKTQDGGRYIQVDASGRQIGKPVKLDPSKISRIERRDEMEDPDELVPSKFFKLGRVVKVFADNQSLSPDKYTIHAIHPRSLTLRNHTSGELETHHVDRIHLS